VGTIVLAQCTVYVFNDEFKSIFFNVGAWARTHDLDLLTCSPPYPLGYYVKLIMKKKYIF
jgi:hypothetical protein